MASSDPIIVFAKYVLFGLNFLIWVLGAILIGVSVWIRADGGLWEYNVGLDLDNYYSACYVVMIPSIIILIIGFVGCLGTALESPCMLIGYCILSVVCIFFHITACVLVWRIAGGDQLQDEMARQIQEHIVVVNDNTDSRRFLDLLQIKLECCGAATYTDYTKLGQVIPPSCSSERTGNVYIRSCGENLRRYLEVRGGVLGGVALSLVLLQIIAVVFNGCLFFILRQEDIALL